MEIRQRGRKPVVATQEHIEELKKHKREYNNDYMKRTLDSLRITVHKYKRLPELMDLAVERGFAKSKQALVVSAIEEKLKEWGISINDLPTINEDNEAK